MAAGPGGGGMLPFLRLLGQLKVGAGPLGRGARGWGGCTGKGASLPGQRVRLRARTAPPR